MTNASAPTVDANPTTPAVDTPDMSERQTAAQERIADALEGIRDELQIFRVTAAPVLAAEAAAAAPAAPVKKG